MRKKIGEDFTTKSHKREQKNRPRMKVHGRSLKLQISHAGKKISKR